ncbi:MAG: GNAT family N-acetyltransferase [Candidatus Latescibacteria bacterium]|nr:GNAT family N-acetyltransferase [Candidatus Latescibacterota bacterium]
MSPADRQKTTYRLEMASRDELRPPQQQPTDLDIRRVEIACPEFNWFLHQLVGVEFRWGGRQHWGLQEWTQYVDRPELETWVAYVEGTPAGYYELEKQDDGSVRIECFGLRRPFIGRGYGGTLLARAIDRCWEMGADHVWLSTCSHDHPHALKNYLARGFKLIRETTGAANPPGQSALFGSGASPANKGDEPA